MLSCYKNSRLTFSDDHVITIMARTVIKAGEAIYHTYARTFNTTTIRRIGLFQVRIFPQSHAHSTPYTWQGKHFSCECVRCKDPTELGTFASAVLCSSSACRGLVTAADPLDLTRW